MIPTLLADGTVLADDAGELGLYHTTAHGKWAASANDGLPDRPGTHRLKATFLWFGQFGPPPTNRLDNAVRTRFVTYFDPADPDRMIGFIQPFLFSFVPPGFSTGGIVNVVPASPADNVASNHTPLLDPLASLPAGCTLPPAGGCLGAYRFVIRRIKAQ
jgi:hypothetical protein